MRQFLLICLLIISFHTFAQTEKGTIMAGGQLALTTNKNASSFVLNPNLGFFVANNVALGGNLALSFAKAGSVRTNEFGIGPFVRCYFTKGQAKPFVVASGNYISSSIRTDISSISNTGFGMLLGGGFAAFLNRNVAVEAIAGYNYAKYSNVDGNGGFSLSLGFQLYFNKSVVKDLQRTVTGE